jgi:hypothetical protein
MPSPASQQPFTYFILSTSLLLRSWEGVRGKGWRRVLIKNALPCIPAAFHLLFAVHLFAAKVRVRRRVRGKGWRGVLINNALPCIATAIHLLFVVQLISAKVRGRG